MFDDIAKLQIENIYAPVSHTHAYRCPKCKRLHYPAVLRCKDCGYRRYPEDEVEFVWHKRNYESWEKVSLDGPCKLVTFTRLWALPAGFSERYLDFAVVAFENGVNAVGLLRLDDPKLGQQLVASTKFIRTIGTDDFYGLVFESA